MNGRNPLKTAIPCLVLPLKGREQVPSTPESMANVVWRQNFMTWDEEDNAYGDFLSLISP